MPSKVKNQLNEVVTIRLTAADLNPANPPSFVGVNLDARNGGEYVIVGYAVSLCFANPADEALLERLTIAFQRGLQLPPPVGNINTVDDEKEQVYRLDMRAPLARDYEYIRPRCLDAGQNYGVFLYPMMSALPAGTSILSLTLFGRASWDRGPGGVRL